MIKSNWHTVNGYICAFMRHLLSLFREISFWVSKSFRVAFSICDAYTQHTCSLRFVSSETAADFLNWYGTNPAPHILLLAEVRFIENSKLRKFFVITSCDIIGKLVLVHTERLQQQTATKMGYTGCLLDILHGVTVTANCDCNTLVLQGVIDMIAVNESCTHFVQQVSVTPYTHPTTRIVIDSIAVAVVPCERALS